LPSFIYKEIIVHSNIRIQTYLENYLLELTAELKRLEKSNDVLGNITHLVELISKMTPSYEICKNLLLSRGLSYTQKAFDFKEFSSLSNYFYSFMKQRYNFQTKYAHRFSAVKESYYTVYNHYFICGYQKRYPLFELVLQEHS